MTEDEIREALREMRDIAVPPESLARVRLNLENRVRRRAVWRTSALLAAVSVTLLAAFLFVPKAGRRGAVAIPAVQPPPKVAVIDAPRPEKKRVEDAVPARIPTARVRHRTHRKAPAAMPVTIRIQTPDPDVLILLVGD